VISAEAKPEARHPGTRERVNDNSAIEKSDEISMIQCAAANTSEGEEK
jgi:hypothetical protein